MPEGYDPMKEFRPISGGAQELPPGFEAREAERREFFLTDTLNNPEVPSYEAEELVIHEFLWPSEAQGELISPYEARPLLDVLSRRAGRSVLLRRLEGIMERKKEEENKVRDQLKDPSGLSEEEQADLWKKAERLKASQRRTEVLVENRYQDPEEATEWARMLRETEAAIYLRNRYEQSVGFQYNKDNFIKLLGSEIRATLYPRMLADLLDSPDYGPVMEEATRLLFDVHLLGGFSDPKNPDRLIKVLLEVPADEGVVAAAEKIKVAARERRDGLGAKRSLRNEEKEELQKLEETLNMKIDKGLLKDVPISALQVLQHGDNIKERLVLLEAAIKYQIGKLNERLDDFTLKRGLLLAENLVGFDPLLTSWLSVPRENVAEKGEIEYWEVVSGGANIGFGSFKEGKRNDLRKLVHTRLHNLDQRRRDRPAGPPVLTPALPDVSLPYLVDSATVAVYLDEKTLEVYPGRGGETAASVFEAWYAGNRERARRGFKPVGLSKILRLVPDGAFSFGDYRTGQQDIVLNWLLANTRGGEGDVVLRNFLPDNLRGINKAVQNAFQGRMPVGRLAVVNGLAAAIISWSEKDKPYSEVVSEHEAHKQKIQAGGVTMGDLKRACRISGILNETGQKLFEQAVIRRQPFALEEISPEQRQRLLGS